MKYLKDICADHGIKPTGILHVGASMCEEAEKYQSMGVTKVIWVEAQPESDRRQEQAKKYGHVLHEFTAFSDGKRNATLRIASNEVSSSILPFGRHSVIYPDIIVTKEIPIETVRADEFLKELPPEIDTLVLDVQGAELQVLKGMGKLLNQIKTAWVETNITELYVGCALQPEMDDWMAKAGFPNRDAQMIHWPEWQETLYWR